MTIIHCCRTPRYVCCRTEPIGSLMDNTGENRPQGIDEIFRDGAGKNLTYVITVRCVNP